MMKPFLPSFVSILVLLLLHTQSFGQFGSSQRFFGADNNKTIKQSFVMDFDGDGDSDVMVRQETKTVEFLENLGNGQFADPRDNRMPFLSMIWNSMDSTPL